MTTAALVIFFGLVGSAAACNSLGEQLAKDEPVVKASVSLLEPAERVAGIRLCDDSEILGDWKYLRRAEFQGPYQHALLFQDGQSVRAVVWVEPGGNEIPVPDCPHGDRCADMPEAASIISGDVYTFETVRPGGKLVIVRYPPLSWLVTNGASPGGTAGAGLALDGTWQGTIENEAQNDILRLRLIIDGDNASVWTDHDGTWVEVDQGFRVNGNMGNAVVHATFPNPDSATEDEGANVMTWVIIATPRSPAELLVVSSWVENSADMRKDPEIFRYSSHIAGVLYRESPGH